MKTDFRAALAMLFALLFSIDAAVAQFRPALPGYRYQFPRDYFNHPDYQTEWWYYTGNLRSPEGHQFGFELTFFRQGLTRDPARTSTWDLTDVYLAHFALSDLSGKSFFHTERTNRAGPGLAGASSESQKVWNGNWSVVWEKGAEQLVALADSHALTLSLRPRKPPVIHGENGASQKSAGAGRASHYFSESRLAASGRLEFGGREYVVSGLAWMDHEFFTHQLGAEQAGWDWFSIQLNDNSELMLFRLRKKDGSIDPFSAGTFVNATGKVVHLRSTDFELVPAPDTWVSSATHARYPIRWRIQIRAMGLTLEASTRLPSQELITASNAVPNYWEGAILLQGKKNSSDVAGLGYLEMTGYDHPVSMPGM